MKPSLRRDSLEKAARIVVRNFEIDQGISIQKEAFDALADILVRFAQRQVKKALREAANLVPMHGECFVEQCSLEQEILALTPRGPEKGGRAK